MPRIPISSPKAGVSDNEALQDPARGHAVDASNVRGYDRVTKRRRLSQRAGMVKYAPDPVSVGEKVSRLVSLSTDARNQTYSVMAQAGEEFPLSTTSPSNPPSVAVMRDDKLGNHYFVDGKNVIVKKNPTGTAIWKITLPVLQTQHAVRALWVDEQDAVYIGISTGGSQEHAKLFRYTQGLDSTTKLAWQIDLSKFVEDLRVREGVLYTLQNDPENNAAELVLYTGLFLAEPLEMWRRFVPYPATSLAVSPKDGSIYVSSDVNLDRGTPPTDPLLTATAQGWSWTQLPFFKKRAWSWLLATDIDGNETFNANYTESDSVPLLVDKTGNGRHLFQQTNFNAPIFNPKGCAGKDTIKFLGEAAALGAMGLQSGANTDTDITGAAEQSTLTPGYAGAGWAMFIVCRCIADTNVRMLYAQPRSLTNAGDRYLYLNATHTSANALPPANLAGSVFRYEYPFAGGGGATGGGGTFPLNQLWNQRTADPYSLTNLMVITLVYDGAGPAGVAATNNCTLRVNGRPADRWTAAANETFTAPTIIGGMFNGTTGGILNKPFRGDLCEIRVLRDYVTQQGGSSAIIDDPRQPGVSGNGLIDDTELQRVEGELMHYWGGSHLLPTGAMGGVQFTGIPANNDTVTIAGTVYTFKAVLGAAVGNVLIAGTAALTALNLFNAVNQTGGVSGTDYVAGPANASVFSSWMQSFAAGLEGAGAVTDVYFQSRSPDATSFTLTEVGANTTAIAGSNTFAQLTTLGGAAVTNNSHYPHPFYFKATPSNAGGAPRETGVGSASKASQLNDVGPLTAKFDPAKGDVKWVVVNPTTSNGGLGGFGWGVACSKSGFVFTHGPRSTSPQAGPSTDQIRQINAVVRRLDDLGDSVTTQINLGSSLGWIYHTGTDGNPPTGTFRDTKYHFPRLDTDEFDNVFVPWNENDMPNGCLVFLANGGGGGGYNAPLYKTIFPDSQRALCVCVDARTPIYSPDAVLQTERFTVGTLREWTGLLTLTGQPGNNESVTVGGKVYRYRDVNNVLGGGAFALALPNDVLIGASAAASIANLKAAVNVETPIGARYEATTALNAEFSATVATAATLLVRAKDSTATPAVAETLTNGSWAGAAASNNSIQTAKIVRTTLSTGSPRSVRMLAVAGTDLKLATGGVITGLVGGTGNSVFAAGKQYVSAAVVNGEAFFTDGFTDPVVFSPKTGRASTFKATSSGEVPKKQKLYAEWRNRLIAARGLDNPHTLYGSARGNAYDWNFSPAVPLATQAWNLEFLEASGVPDAVQAICPVQDDFMYVLCMTSIHRVTGDPAQGGDIHRISDATGGAFGKSWAKDDRGNFFFVGFPYGGVWMIPPGSSLVGQVAHTPQELTENSIAARLSTIDWTLYTVELAWDTRRDGLWYFVVPYANPAMPVKAYFWDREDNAWWPDDFASTTLNPTCVLVLDGDTDAHRDTLIGCADGYTRAISDDAVNDDGLAIDSRVTVGPMTPGEGANEYTFDDLTAVLGSEQNGCNWEMYASEDPSVVGSRVAAGSFTRGRNQYQNSRATGAYVVLKLRNASAAESWSLEGLSIDAWEAGIRRKNG